MCFYLRDRSVHRSDPRTPVPSTHDQEEEQRLHLPRLDPQPHLWCDGDASEQHSGKRRPHLPRVSPEHHPHGPLPPPHGRLLQDLQSGSQQLGEGQAEQRREGCPHHSHHQSVHGPHHSPHLIIFVYLSSACKYEIIRWGLFIHYIETSRNHLEVSISERFIGADILMLCKSALQRGPVETFGTKS